MPSSPMADASDDEVTRLDGLTIDVGRHEVRVDDEPVELTSLEFQLLTALAEAPGRCSPVVQLIERVWGWDFYGDERLVDVHIGNLRRALGDAADDPRFIGTVRGVGYKCVGSARSSRAWVPRRLRTRLFLSYVVVVAAGAITMVVVGAAVTKTVYERRLGGFGFGRGQGGATGPSESQTHLGARRVADPGPCLRGRCRIGRRGDRGDDRRCPRCSDRSTNSERRPAGWRSSDFATPTGAGRGRTRLAPRTT